MTNEGHSTDKNGSSGCWGEGSRSGGDVESSPFAFAICTPIESAKTGQEKMKVF